MVLRKVRISSLNMVARQLMKSMTCQNERRFDQRATCRHYHTSVQTLGLEAQAMRLHSHAELITRHFKLQLYVWPLSEKLYEGNPVKSSGISWRQLRRRYNRPRQAMDVLQKAGGEFARHHKQADNEGHTHRIAQAASMFRTLNHMKALV
ncbi:unnamed protein product [Polarella glacialis]|uniref:Uncharacterized protein n=1 Tax=Polarella glacialis TaxID=89957 RepID=A0A813DJN2_POLGL|nr:unnamed protein product [Polarella glacialis]